MADHSDFMWQNPPMKMMTDFVTTYGSRTLGALRLLGMLSLVLALVPVQIVYRLARPSDPFRITRFFHRSVIWILSFRVRVHGTVAGPSPVLFVANHASYLDIPVLSTLLPAAFAAKAEVAGWPLIGFLAKLQNTVFIERRSTQIEKQRGVLRALLEKRQSLIIFPEGTSTDGMKVLPFKSSLFSITEDADIGLTVQPVSITCTCLDGLPITRSWRPYYAWYGDMTLVGHLWNVLKLGHFTVDVIFHPPVHPQSFADRKVLAQYCHQQVARGIEQCLKGRDFSVAPQKLRLAKPA